MELKESFSKLKDQLTLAVFDVDGTLTHKDTFLEFLKSCRGRWFYYFCFLANSPFLFLYFLKLFPNYRLKEKFFGFYFKGKKQEDVLQLGRQFAMNRLPELFYQSGKAVLDWHLDQGHKVIFLTASSSIWLKPWTEQLGILLVGTEFETQNSVFTGRIAGENCFGMEKVHRLQVQMKELGISHIAYAYGDSKSDLFYLELANQSFCFPLTEKKVKENLQYVKST